MNLTNGVAQDVADMSRWNDIIRNSANKMAELLDGKLEHVSSWQLRRLKRQLSNFNATTNRWNHE